VIFIDEPFVSGLRQSCSTGTQMTQMQQILVDSYLICGNLPPICPNLRSIFNFDVAVALYTGCDCERSAIAR
jgi:hypothetical protein